MPDPITGGRRRGASVKTLKRALKKAGLKTTGRKAALTRRAKKAHLKLRGGGDEDKAARKAACESPNTWDDSADSGKGRCVPPSEMLTPPDYEGPSGGRHRRRHRSRKH